MLNDKGMEVRQAIYYIQPAKPIIHSEVTTIEEAPLLSKNVVDISPSRRFGFRIDVDEEGTYDVNVRFNPKRFFGIATGVASIVTGFKNRTLLSGGV